LESHGGFSDLDIAAGEPIKIFVQGKVKQVTKRRLSSTEVQGFVNHMAKDESAYTQVISGGEVDRSYATTVPSEDGLTVFRYRLNVVSVINKFGQNDAHICMRSINSEPMRLKDLKLEEGLLAHLVARQGLGLVVGETGSGKSTLLSAIIGEEARKEGNFKKILTAEAPVEYVYFDCTHPSNIVFQQEVAKIGGCVTSFPKAIRNMLRRNPSIILIGESRDRETMEATIRAASTGHMTYTTLHANGVGEAVRRILNEFPEEAKKARLYELMPLMNFVVVQYLAKTIDGKRVALREFLVFTPEIIQTLQTCPVDDVVNTINNYVKSQGQTMEMAAKRQLDLGVITQGEYEYVVSGI